MTKFPIEAYRQIYSFYYNNIYLNNKATFPLQLLYHVGVTCYVFTVIVNCRQSSGL